MTLKSRRYLELGGTLLLGIILLDIWVLVFGWTAAMEAQCMYENREFLAQFEPKAVQIVQQVLACFYAIIVGSAVVWPIARYAKSDWWMVAAALWAGVAARFGLGPDLSEDSLTAFEAIRIFAGSVDFWVLMASTLAGTWLGKAMQHWKDNQRAAAGSL